MRFPFADDAIQDKKYKKKRLSLLFLPGALGGVPSVVRPSFGTSDFHV